MGLAFSTRSEFFTSHLVARNVTHVYAQLHGKAPSTPPDLGPGFTLAVHAVFDGTHAWGARFAKISDVVRGHAKVVPYIGGDPLPRPRERRAAPKARAACAGHLASQPMRRSSAATAAGSHSTPSLRRSHGHSCLILDSHLLSPSRLPPLSSRLPLASPLPPHLPLLSLSDTPQLPFNSCRFAQHAVCSWSPESSTRSRSDVAFAFANHQPFCLPTTAIHTSHALRADSSARTPSLCVAIPGAADCTKPQPHALRVPPSATVRFVGNLQSAETKGAFVDACDAMLHARQEGETFGLAIAEFAAGGKPILTYGRPPADGRAHLNILGAAARAYATEAELIAAIDRFDKDEAAAGDGLRALKAYRAFAPATVMRRFCEVFG